MHLVVLQIVPDDLSEIFAQPPFSENLSENCLIEVHSTLLTWSGSPAPSCDPSESGNLSSCDLLNEEAENVKKSVMQGKEF